MARHSLWFLFTASLAVSLALILCVARGWADGADRALQTALERRGATWRSDRPSRLITATRDFTALGGDTLRILFLVSCMSGLFADRRAATAWQLLAIFVTARIMLFLLKAMIRRPRPDPAGHGVATYTTSFPSGHTFMAVSLFVASALLIPATQPAAVRAVAAALALIVSLMIAATRLTLRIHWPSDVLVGWVSGVAWALGWVLAIG